MTAVPIRVAGVSRTEGHYPHSLFELARLLDSAVVDPVVEVSLFDALDGVPEPTGERIAVDLVREPDNPEDPHAVRVEVPALVGLGHHCHVGWIPADTAPVYAERLDAGMVPDAWVREIPVGSPTDMRPGLRILVDWPDFSLTNLP